MVRLLRKRTFEAEDRVLGLDFSDSGKLGIAASDGHAYILDAHGIPVFKGHAYLPMEDVSHCCGKFGFINQDGKVFMIDEDGYLLNKISVGVDYTKGITMTPDGFAVCGSGCAFFDHDGDKRWEIHTNLPLVQRGPSYYQDYWYIAEWIELVILKDGKIVNVMENSGCSNAYIDTAVCGKHLAVLTYRHLYLYDLSDPANPREIWKTGDFDYARQVAFSPDCKYIAVADKNNMKLKVYDINGNSVLEKGYGSRVWSVAWWRDLIAVGVDRLLHLYEVRR